MNKIIRRLQCCLAAIIFSISTVLCLGQPAADTNLSPAQIEGRALVREILSQRPQTNTSMAGTLKIRDANGKRTATPMVFKVGVTETNWSNLYAAGQTSVAIFHSANRQDDYQFSADNGKLAAVSGGGLMLPFASSDFWLCDLGLEFFRWPEQKILKHEMKRGRSCKVLESTNPVPGTNTYSRVVSWIDNESRGIVQAEAYDFGGRKLKEFEPTNFEKDSAGNYQLQAMEMRNVQTGSRSRIQFDFAKKKPAP